jgi:CotH kinase protein/Lamin Tail Domain/Chitobiase/beta-hexosaminidase C-terminal domain/Secretion system C-terminal sorting domain
MRKNYLLILFIFFLILNAPAQILINEISSAGYSPFVDEDGDVEDWVEFYNAGTQTVNLAGYKVTAYQENKLQSWTFPEYYLAAGDRVTIFFSGKNRTDYFDHWEIPVLPQSANKYQLGISEPPSNWREVSFNDAAWQNSVGNVGYGDGDDATVISPSISVYQRYSFVLSDTSRIASIAFLNDFDDAFVAYLNGKEIARYNVGAQGVPPPYSDYAFDEHEANQYQNGGWSALFIIAAKEADTILQTGTNVLSIQTHNFLGGMDDLTQIPVLLIGVKDTTVVFTPFAADIRLHTDFDLHSGGQLLTLYTPQGTISDQQALGEILLDHSRGRQPDGSSNWCLFDQPSPDTVNFSASCFLAYAASPHLDLSSGFYNNTQSVTISSAAAGTIYYTRNGGNPILSSSVYSSAILVDSTQVIRARLYPSDPNYLPGPAVAASYFINEQITLPVVSLITDPANLFDPNYGIYVLGVNPDTAFGDIPFHNANFWQGWVRSGDISFFDANKNLQFEQPVSVRIQGNWSKIFPQKGFFFDCDENYRGKPIKYKLFPEKNATTYKGFNVRNAGSDFGSARMRDMTVQKAAADATDLDIMDGFACVVFINGQFWGVYEAREKQDKHFLANNSTTDDDQVDFLQFDGDIIEGDNKHFFNTVAFISSADLTQEMNYDSARALLDIPNFCDYFITETFVGNQDWLGSYTNNIKYWRPHTATGKWRYILWDADICYQSDTVNILSLVINPPTDNPHSDMFRSLLVNDSFRVYFINRYADLMNTAYYGLNMVYRAEDYYYLMLPEMDRHFAMWGNTSHTNFTPSWLQWPMDTSSWRAEVDILEYYMYVRPFYVRNQIQSQFGMTSQERCTWRTEPADAGLIHVNTITPDSLPWTGIYFNGNPITMTAEAKPGYKFSHWEWTNGTEHYTSPYLRVNTDTTMEFVAHFEPLDGVFNMYPNPFDDLITIYYEVPTDGVVSLRVYDLTGRLVTEILPSSNYQKQGAYQITISATALGLSNGMYLFQMQTSSFTKTVKMIGGRSKP